jgi:Zn-dependent peptidase ImmA (M78 family)
MAAVILDRFAKRRSGFYVDIEGIVEDCQITILNRRGGLEKHVHGYAALDPKFIVMAEMETSQAPFYRHTLAHEFCHIVLEWDLFSGGSLPNGSDGHELTTKQHQEIESNAKDLALAILLPKTSFGDRFNAVLGILSPDEIARHLQITSCVDNLEREFQVWFYGIVERAIFLNLLSKKDAMKHFSDRFAL